MEGLQGIIRLSGNPYFGQGKVREFYAWNPEWTLDWLSHPIQRACCLPPLEETLTDKWVTLVCTDRPWRSRSWRTRRPRRSTMMAAPLPSNSFRPLSVRLGGVTNPAQVFCCCFRPSSRTQRLTQSGVRLCVCVCVCATVFLHIPQNIMCPTIQTAAFWLQGVRCMYESSLNMRWLWLLSCIEDYHPISFSDFFLINSTQLHLHEIKPFSVDKILDATSWRKGLVVWETGENGRQWCCSVVGLYNCMFIIIIIQLQVVVHNGTSSTDSQSTWLKPKPAVNEPVVLAYRVIVTKCCCVGKHDAGNHYG